jgi:hypothetical protein
MTDTEVRTESCSTETCCVQTDHGIPVALSVGDRESTVGCRWETPANNVAAALHALGFDVLGRMTWVNCSLSILAVRRRDPS